MRLLCYWYKSCFLTFSLYILCETIWCDLCGQNKIVSFVLCGILSEVHFYNYKCVLIFSAYVFFYFRMELASEMDPGTDFGGSYLSYDLSSSSSSSRQMDSLEKLLQKSQKDKVVVLHLLFFFL